MSERDESRVRLEAVKLAARKRSRMLAAGGGKFGILLVALLGLILFAPLVAEHERLVPFLGLFGGAVLVAGLHAARPTRGVLMLGIALAAADFALGRLVVDENLRWLLSAELVFWLITLVYVAVTILEAIFGSREVNLGTLQAALCVYLLIGLIGAFALTFVELHVPGSFIMEDGSRIAFVDAQNVRAFMKLFAFSFGILSGVGSAGVNCATGFASNAAAVEGMISQIYLAVVVARLVGFQPGPSATAES